MNFNLFSRGQIQKITKVTSTQEKQKCFNFEFYLKNFLTFLYYLLLLPFKLEHYESKVRVKFKWTQAVLCSITYSITFLHTLFGIKAEIGDSLYKRPEQIFMIFTSIVFCMYLLAFLYTLICKKDLMIHSLRQFDSLEPREKYTHWISLASCLLPVCQLILTVISLEQDAFKDSCTYKRKLLLKLNRITFQNNYNASELAEDGCYSMSIASQAVVGVYLVTKFYQVFSCICLEMLVLICVYGIYEKSCFLLDECSLDSLKLPDLTHVKLNEMLDNTIASLKFMDNVSQFISALVFWAYIEMISWLALATLDVWENSDWVSLALNLQYYTYYGTISFIAAEAHKNANTHVENIKGIIFHISGNADCNGESSRTLLKCVHFRVNFVAEKAMGSGVRGGPFFLVTYNFLGVALTTMVTYIMLALQLKSASASNACH